MKNLLFYRIAGLISRISLLGSVKAWNKTRHERPIIFVANHPSTLDPFFVIGSLPQPVHIMVSEYIFQIPLLGYILRKTGHIKVARGKGGQAYIDGRTMLIKGGSLLIFPEGAVSTDKSRVQHIHTGAVRLAMETHVPVIPVGIYLNPEKIRKHTVHFGHDTETGDWYSNGMYGISFGKKIAFVGDVRDRGEVERQCRILRERMDEQIRESSLQMHRKNLKQVNTYNILSVLVYFFRMHFAYTNWINS